MLRAYRDRIESAVWAIVIVAMAALTGAAGFGSAALAQQAKTASIPTDDLFWPDTADFSPAPARSRGW